MFCVLATLDAISTVALAQSTDESEDLAFFEIADDSSNDSFFQIDNDKEDYNETEPNYSINGSVRQDVTYGLVSPSEAFSRRKEGVEKINSELFLQIQGKPTDNSKIKMSGVADYNWGSWIDNAYSFGGHDINFELKDFFLDLTVDNGTWIRFGNQIIARGELESVKITDIINPIDISSPGQVEFKDLRIQIPALFVSVPLENATAEVILTNNAGIDVLGTEEAGSAFDYSIINDRILTLLPVDESVLRVERKPSQDLEAIGRLNYKFNGGDISFIIGEINWNQTSLQYVGGTEPLLMEYGVDRVKLIGISGNFVSGNYLFKYETALNDGRKFQRINPLLEWSEHQQVVTGVGLEYNGFSDTVLSLEVNGSNIIKYTSDLSVDENEEGFIVQARWSGLNDLLSIYGSYNQLIGDNSTISTLFVEYNLTDDVKLDGRLVVYDANSISDLFYNFKDQDVVRTSITYSF